MQNLRNSPWRNVTCYLPHWFLLSFCVCQLFTSLGAQEWRLSPLQQTTLMRFAGKETLPVVPVAMLNTKLPNGSLAAAQLAAQRGETLITRSFNAQAANALPLVADSLTNLFATASLMHHTLYFEACASLFDHAAPTPAEIGFRTQLYALLKHHQGAVLFQCNSLNTWYKLAKEASCGMLSLD